ncbi:hypothetical protein MLD38_020196 [Melastoma candidum]|uniref:Uncharacterized protein n=1 Tax=Melastoma candidum TaxID=119954 RepID=A0ACB9QFX5_9MYRT|nr:hypothetical protein MLD38_020196 [Melastoma candidum]
MKIGDSTTINVQESTAGATPEGKGQVRFFVVVMAIVAGYLVPSPSSRFTSRSLAHTLSLFTHTFPVLVLHKDITTIS